MTDALLPGLLAGDQDDIASWNKITERETKYLGLDSASKVELNGGVRYDIDLGDESVNPRPRGDAWPHTRPVPHHGQRHHQRTRRHRQVVPHAPDTAPDNPTIPPTPPPPP